MDESTSTPQTQLNQAFSPDAVVALLPWQRQKGRSVPLFPPLPKRPTPQFQLGDRCRWVPIPETEWGTIVGVALMPEEQDPNTFGWEWIYLVLLDGDSPSAGWVMAEWAEESDLERLPVESQRATSDSCGKGEGK